MTARLSTWKFAAAALAATVCLSGCQTVGSWFPQHDKVSDARANATTSDTTPTGPITAEQRINVQLAVARSFEDENQPEQAAKIYLDIIKKEKDGGGIAAYHRLALLYSKKGEWDQSQKYFDIAVKKAPKDIELRCRLGYSYYLQRRDKEAEACLRRAIAIEADNGLAHNNLGLLLARQGREEDALKEFSLAGCNQAQAHANLAMAYSFENRLPDAQAQYRIALAADPNLLIAKNGLAALESVDRSLIRANNVERPPLIAPGVADSF